MALFAFALLALAQAQAGTALESHLQALSPDEKSFAYTVGEGGLRVVELPSGKERWRISIDSAPTGGPGWSHWGGDIAWSPDGGRIAALTHDGRLTVLRAADGTALPGFALTRIATRDYRPNPWETARFLSGGERLLVVGPSAQLIDATSGAVLKEYPWAVTASTTSRDRKHFALGDGNGVVAVYSGATGEVEAGPLWLPRAIWALDFDADAKRLAVGAGDCKVRVFALPIVAPPLELSHCDYPWYDGDGIGSVQFAPDGKTLLSSTQGSWDVRCWNLEHSSMLWEYDYGGGNPGPMPATFAKDSSIAILSIGGYVHDVQTGKRLQELGEKLGGGAFSSAGGLAWSSARGKITVVEPRTGELVCEIPLASR